MTPASTVDTPNVGKDSHVGAASGGSLDIEESGDIATQFEVLEIEDYSDYSEAPAYWTFFADDIGQQFSKEVVERKLKEFLHISSRESIATAKDSLKKAHAKLNEAIEKSQLLFRNTFSDIVSKVESTRTEEMSVMSMINPSCIVLSEDFLQQSKVNPLDYSLLRNFVKFGGDAATGVEAVTGLRMLLEQKRKVIEVTYQLNEFENCRNEVQRAQKFIRQVLGRKKLKLGPRDSYIINVYYLRKDCLRVLEEIETIKKQILE